MNALKKLYHHHRETWEHPSVRLLVLGHGLLLLAYGATLWFNPEQFDHLIAYRVMSETLPAQAWGTVAIVAGTLLWLSPALHSRVRGSGLLLAGLVWSINVSTIYVSTGINTPVAVYAVLALLALLGYVRGRS